MRRHLDGVGSDFGVDDSDVENPDRSAHRAGAAHVGKMEADALALSDRWPVGVAADPGIASGHEEDSLRRRLSFSWPLNAVLLEE